MIRVSFPSLDLTPRGDRHSLCVCQAAGPWMSGNVGQRRAFVEGSRILIRSSRVGAAFKI